MIDIQFIVSQCGKKKKKIICQEIKISKLITIVSLVWTSEKATNKNIY